MKSVCYGALRRYGAARDHRPHSLIARPGCRQRRERRGAGDLLLRGRYPSALPSQRAALVRLADAIGRRRPAGSRGPRRRRSAYRRARVPASQGRDRSRGPAFRRPLAALQQDRRRAEPCDPRPAGPLRADRFGRRDLRGPAADAGACRQGRHEAGRPGPPSPADPGECLCRRGPAAASPGAMLPVVARAWERWARWLLERRELLAAWSLHVDQVAMALALAAEGIETFELDARWNFPLHLPALAGPDPAPPAVIHYHQQVDATGQLSPAGIPALDRRIDEANRAFGEVCREAFPNATFWEWRYLTDPELGSGVGSRGEPLADKRALLSVLLAALRPASVLDVGCGDGEATRGLPMPGYVGLDLSAAAVQRARAGRPDGDHRVGTLADQPHAVQADLTVCLDVLIHQADAAGYHDLVSRLWRSAARALLISGYEHPFRATSPMIHFHEPLSASIRRLDPDAAIHPLREVHGITTWLVLKALPDRPADDPRDLPLAAVIELLEQRAERAERIGDLEAKVAACGAEIERWRQRVTAMEAT